jgi:hypothetical protein
MKQFFFSNINSNENQATTKLSCPQGKENLMAAQFHGKNLILFVFEH